MSKNIHRGFVATLAAGALTLSLAPMASANNQIDTDGPAVVAPPAETVESAQVFRIADSTRILTAIEASQSRSDWGEGLEFISDLRWDCSASIPLDGTPTPDGIQAGDKILVINGSVIGLVGGVVGGLVIPSPGDANFDAFIGAFFGAFAGEFTAVGVECEAVELGEDVARGRMDIIVARADDYPDALAAGPLADVLNAPILLNPSSSLDADVAAEINRLGSLGGARYTTVHILGGTNALSDGVKDSILGLANVDNVVRYQGIDRYETAVGIATQTINNYNFETPFKPRDVNAYITTGINFPDALAAGAAAANNDGVVVLTDGTQLDRRGFTEQFLINLSNLVKGGVVNTSENFAVGGPSAAAAATFDIRLAPNGAYVGADRYETATLTAAATFGPGFSGDYAVVSGEGFADALVAGGFIANLDGPLLLTRATTLSPVTAGYLNATVKNGDRIFTFGGPDSLRLAVTDEIKALLEAKFAIDPEIR
jgi:putative cell wall-binding protein